MTAWVANNWWWVWGVVAVAGFVAYRVRQAAVATKRFWPESGIRCFLMSIRQTTIGAQFTKLALAIVVVGLVLVLATNLLVAGLNR